MGGITIDRFRLILVGDDSLDADYKIGDQRIPRKQIEFNDLVPLATLILNNSAIARNAIRFTYGDVFLDEFQDCTDKQYELVKTAFRGTSIRLTAVGDTKQRIMGWAGALDGIFEKFAKDFNASPLNMYLNFRSKPVLLRMQNEIIRALDPLAVMPEVQIMGDDGEVSVLNFHNCQQEAHSLADMIEAWIKTGQIKLSEIAVLVSKQLSLYAGSLMTVLKERGIPFRNEQQMQDIATEPLARLIVDFLSCLYGQREPKAWIRLMNQLIPFADDELQSSKRQGFQSFFNEQRKKIALKELIDEAFSGWWEFVRSFLKKIGIETLTALSPDYESPARLKEVVKETKRHIEEMLELEPFLPKALERFSDDQAIRILTIHKSKGLEFDSVIIMAIENEIFFGDPEANRCAFFVGVSRAKRRLILTYADRREKPPGHHGRWVANRTAQMEYLNYANHFL